uniref:Uncharacterized protein n=1 Tax=Anguilla anguilla TaxID=7936 RepID=A0A0E9Q6M8_ANGAN
MCFNECVCTSLQSSRDTNRLYYQAPTYTEQMDSVCSVLFLLLLNCCQNPLFCYS